MSKRNRDSQGRFRKEEHPPKTVMRVREEEKELLLRRRDKLTSERSKDMRKIFYDNYLETEEGEVRSIPILNREEIGSWVHDQVSEIAEEDTEVYLSPTPPTMALITRLMELCLGGFTEGLDIYVLIRKSTTKTKGTSNKKKYSPNADSDFDIFIAFLSQPNTSA